MATLSVRKGTKRKKSGVNSSRSLTDACSPTWSASSPRSSKPLFQSAMSCSLTSERSAVVAAAAVAVAALRCEPNASARYSKRKSQRRGTAATRIATLPMTSSVMSLFSPHSRWRSVTREFVLRSSVWNVLSDLRCALISVAVNLVSSVSFCAAVLKRSARLKRRWKPVNVLVSAPSSAGCDESWNSDMKMLSISPSMLVPGGTRW